MVRQQQTWAGEHAVVIGGSMAGLLTARVLSSHFSRVTLIERDAMHDQPESRKGQPQTRHLHGLLAKGLSVMRHYFPDLQEALVDHGAIIGDMGMVMRWYAHGGYRIQHESGMNGALMSRPLLEWQIRRRVLALPNVTVWDQCDVEEPLADAARTRIVGVKVTRRAAGNHTSALMADLTVDASGRGSASPKWLAALGYGKPKESIVKIDIGYATRIFKRRPADLPGAELVIISPEPPHNRRGGFLFPIEGDRWICTLGGWGGDHAPADEHGYLAFAKSLAAPDLYNIISRAEPLSDILLYKYPASLRRHYEKMAAFPEGYLVLGDALCSFNPVYGQGMTSAAMQAAALDQVLARRGNLAGIARPFFREAARVVDIPWQLAVGEDFRFAETEGRKAPGTDFINAYIDRVYQALHHDPVVYDEFLKVMNLMQQPASLFHPKVLWRLFRGRHEKPVAPLAQAHNVYTK